MESIIPWGERELSELRETLGREMSAKRFAHTCGVERMVVRLCGLYAPEETDRLRAAALLHDITKELPLEEQAALCRRLGVPAGGNDRLCPKIFHARTAAALIPERYPLFADEAVLSAVRRHTTGDGEMTLTDKLLYLADYIDESRTFPDCVRLRAYFFGADPDAMDRPARLRHLRLTLLLSYDMTMQALLNERAIICEDTLRARNQLIREEIEDRAARTPGTERKDRKEPSC